jgi:hypothetical protein
MLSPYTSEKHVLDTSRSNIYGVVVGANQIAGPVKAGEQLPIMFDELMRLAGAA